MMLESRHRRLHHTLRCSIAFVAQSLALASVLFCPHADGTAQGPGVPAAPITVNVESAPANVALSGFDVQFLALVSPSGGVFTPTGVALNSDALPVKITDDYFARAKRVRDPSHLNRNFGAILVFTRKPGFANHISVAWHGSAGMGNGSLYPGLAVDNGLSDDPSNSYAVFLPVTFCSNKNGGKVDLKTIISYGPAIESFDISLNGPVAPHQFAGMNVNAFVWMKDSSPGIDPETQSQLPACPFVRLEFDAAQAIPGVEVQAITTDNRMVRAIAPAYYDRPPNFGKAMWMFEMHGENPAALFNKFVVRAYRVQPIIWTGLTLPPGTKPYFDNPPAGSTPPDSAGK
jgi:hypothetical protein